jgi:hypothetical protein
MRSSTRTKGRERARRPWALRTEGARPGLLDGRTEPRLAALTPQMPEPALATPGNCAGTDWMERLECRDEAGLWREDDRDGAVASLLANVDRSSSKGAGQNVE